MEFVKVLLMILLICSSVFLILLVLIQRGRGGGLAGAFGGMGGQSAFGTKAGDLFTRITIVTAAIWILLCAASVKIFSSGENRLNIPAGQSSAGTTPGQEEETAGEGRNGEGALPLPGLGGENKPAEGASEKSSAPASGGAASESAPANSTPESSTPAESAPGADQTPATSEK